MFNLAWVEFGLGAAFRQIMMLMHSSFAAVVPMVTLNNGVEMPMVSLGTWQYTSSVAESAVTLGLSLGFNHIDTANNCKWTTNPHHHPACLWHTCPIAGRQSVSVTDNNQDGVGAALKGFKCVLSPRPPLRTSH